MNSIKKGNSIIGPTLLISAMILASCTESSNWPQFRGPEANMLVADAELPDKWGEDLNVAWTYEVEGDGWASPVVWENQVFVFSVVAELINKPGEGEEEEEGNEDLYLRDIYRWELSSVDLETGEELWKKVVHQGNPTIMKHRNTNYASETPVTDGERIYLYIGMIGVYCFDMNGELLWEKDLGAFDTMNDWGTGSSPVLYQGRLYIQVDNEEQSFLVALNAETGEEIWRVNRDEVTSYSTPFIWKNGKGTELVTIGFRARSYEPATGKLLWELQVNGRRSIPGPVATRDHLYLGNVEHRTIPGTFFAVKAGAKGDITPDTISRTSDGIAWYYDDISTGNPSPLLHEGLLYLLSSRGGGLICLDAGTGEIVYQEKLDGMGASWASPWIHGDKIFLPDEKGLTKVIRTGRNFEFLHENRLDDRFWASVAVAGDAYLFKGDKKLYCVKK